MPTVAFRYQFHRRVKMSDVEASLVLAIWATESLHGEASTRLDAGHVLDESRRTLVIETGTVVGHDLNRLFVGFVQREVGPDAFTVERVMPAVESHPLAVA